MTFSPHLIDEAHKIIHYLIGYAKNPIGEIRKLPSWDWKKLFLIQISIAIVSGSLFGIIGQSWGDFFSGILLLPIITLFTAGMASLFFYYTFLFIQHIALPLRSIFTLILLSTLPYYLIHPFASLLSPLDLIGFALSGILLIVGLVDNFDLPKKTVIKIIALIYLVFFILWAAARIASVDEQKNIRNRINNLGSSSTEYQLQ